MKASPPRFPLAVWFLPLCFLMAEGIRYLSGLYLKGNPYFSENPVIPLLFVLFILFPFADRISVPERWSFPRWKTEGLLFFVLLPLWIALNSFARRERDFLVPAVEFWHFKGWMTYLLLCVYDGWRVPVASYLSTRMPSCLPAWFLALLFGLFPYLLFLPLLQVPPGLAWWMQQAVTFLAFYWLFSRKITLFALWLFTWRWFFPAFP